MPTFKEKARKKLEEFTETLLGVIKDKHAPPEAVAIQLAVTIHQGMLYCGEYLSTHLGTILIGSAYRSEGLCYSCEGDNPNKLEPGEKTCKECQEKSAAEKDS